MFKAKGLTWSRQKCLKSHWLCCSRAIYSLTGKWVSRLNRDIRLAIEEYWKPRLQAEDEAVMRSSEPGKKKYYVLSMFPYPSGKLHMGHVRVYTISDTMARYHRLLGHEVIHPMGWDAFGLPAENAAIERNELPQDWTYSNIKAMRAQLDDLCCSFNWDTEVTTCDPSYYKWTQYIFLKMHDAGLVYRKQAEVNWDPVDQTVLADEQVDEQGLSWRSGAKVEKRYLRQWYVRATSYSKSLQEGLDTVDSDLWKDIRKIQRNFIGDCSGCRIEFKVKENGQYHTDPLSVYTTTPELLHGVSHIVLSAKHRFNDQGFFKQKIDDHSTVLILEAEHPVTKATIPVIVSSSREFVGHTDSLLGIPCVHNEDRTVADTLNLPWQEVLDEESSKIVNSEGISGLSREEAFDAISKQAREGGYGGHLMSPHLKDWLISRQRYWGTPIPMIHCDNCGAVPVPYEDLPVVLPPVTEFTGKGASPLTQNKEWLNVKCPKCGGAATRETDTMDTFLDSAWYFLRYLDSENTTLPCDPEKANKYMPVDLYVGGKEHALLHLYYARFFNHFLCDIGLTKHREPFVNLLTQGMVKGKSYKVKKTGHYLRRKEVDFSGAKPVEKATGEALVESWEKMSKSKHNGYDPQEVMEEYGIDSTRLCILANVAPKSDRNWSFEVYTGVTHWQVRLWSLITVLIDIKQPDEDTSDYCNSEEFHKIEKQIRRSRNEILREVSYHMNSSFLLNTVIARFHELVNELKKIPADHVSWSYEFERAVADLVVMVSPFAPNFASELWAGLQSISSRLKPDYNWGSGVRDQRWPVLDDDCEIKVYVSCNDFNIGIVTSPLRDFNQLDVDSAISLVKKSDFYQQVINNCAIKDARLELMKDVHANLILNVPGAKIEMKPRPEKKPKAEKKDKSFKKQTAQS